MSEPDDHASDASDEAVLAALTSALRTDGPDPSSVEEWVASFEAPPVTEPPAGGSAAPAPGLLPLARAVLAVAAVVAIALVAIVWVSRDEGTARPSAAPPSLEEARVDSADARGDEPAGPTETRRRSDRLDGVETARSIERPRRARPSPGAGPSEASLIREARTLVSGDPSRAMRVLGRHRSEYPDGVLSEERDALTIEAWIALGERSRSLRALARFERTYPGSAHLERLRQAMSRAAPSGTAPSGTAPSGTAPSGTAPSGEESLRR